MTTTAVIPRVILLSLICACRMSAAQEQPVEWAVGSYVAFTERASILALAREIGIANPQKVSLAAPLPVGMDPDCPVVIVESRVTKNGPHRTWAELALRREGVQRASGEPCVPEIDRSSSRQLGRWIADVEDLRRYETWRIEDKDWSVDVRLEPGVSPEAAELIVLAIGRGELVNRLPTTVGPLTIDPAIPDIDPVTITSIKNTGPSDYEIRTGRAVGLVLTVRIVDGAVELHGVYYYMA